MNNCDTKSLVSRKSWDGTTMWCKSDSGREVDIERVGSLLAFYIKKYGAMFGGVSTIRTQSRMYFGRVISESEDTITYVPMTKKDWIQAVHNLGERSEDKV